MDVTGGSEREREREGVNCPKFNLILFTLLLFYTMALKREERIYIKKVDTLTS